MLRAKWRWIQESSSGKPADPAISRSRSSSTASGSAAARRTRRSSRRSAVTHERVARVGDRAAVDRQRVQEAAVRQLDLDESGGPRDRRRPVVHEPHEPARTRGQADVAVGPRQHVRRELRRVVAGRQLADPQLEDRVLRQVEHRVAQPRVRARVAELGDDDRLVRRVETADGLDEGRSEEHTSELQSPCNLVCRLLLEKKKKRLEMSTALSSYLLTY